MSLPIRRSLTALALCGAAAAAGAAPCATATLTSYVSLGSSGCSVGALTFSGFAVEAFPGPTSQQISPGGITFAPIMGGLALSSTSALTAGANTLLGLRFLFRVAAPSLTGGTVSLGTTAGATVDGAITGILDAGPAGNAIGIVVDGYSDPTESFTSASFASYSGYFELGIDGGTAGTARLGPSLASLTFVSTPVVTAVPEPSTTALLGLGVLAAAAAGRRNTRRR